MSYVIVSLPGDQATRDADSFAAWIADRWQPARFFREVSPEHEQVRQEVARYRRVVIFAHNGGGTFRASSGGSPWADAKEIGRICKDARVYAFACNTMGIHSDDLRSGLGMDAVKAGVKIFAGHPTAVPPSTDDHPRGRFEQEVRKAIFHTIKLFLDGESDEKKLRLAAERSFNIVEQNFQNRFMAATAIRSAMASLRIAC
jgi:hypothetical protein